MHQRVAAWKLSWTPDHHGLLSLLIMLALGAIYAPNAPALPSGSRHQRHVPLEGAANFRDLGGYRTMDGRVLKWGLLYRSDALDALTDQDEVYLKTLHIGRLVDFRMPNEAARNPDRLPPGIHRESLPVPLDVPKPNLSRVNAKKELDPEAGAEWLRAIDSALLKRGYPAFVHDSTPAYRKWMQGLLASSPPQAQVFHCTGGADRTGFAAAILLKAIGVPQEAIMRDYLLTNRYLFSPHGREFLDKRTPAKLPDGLKMHARYLQAAFEEIDKEYGSFDAYLEKGLGIDAGAREALRVRYLQ